MHDRTSIAIVGGGISGLTLARTLADLGCSRVVVFERAPAVGGKSCTVDLDGRAHDLGATMGVPIDYRDVLAFSREAGVTTTPFPREQHYSLATGRPRALDRWRDMPAVLAQAARYLRLHAAHWGGSLKDADPGLFDPWAAYAARHGLEAVSRRTLCYRAGFGYGFDSEVPAVMYANLLRPQTLLGLAVGEAFMWRGGTQPIWTALAARLADRVEIRTSTAVTQIIRDGAGVEVHSRGRVERFDRIVIACNPRDLLGVLDASGAERDWFSQVRTYPYATFACEIEGLTEREASIGYLDDNMRADRPGHPMAWVKRYADQPIYVVHLFAPPALSDPEIARRIGDDVARLGGRLVRVRAARRWEFFPHFPSAVMRAGGLAAIDRWQGARRTYLIGEVLSFSTMARVAEHAIAFAHRLVREASEIAPVAVRFAS